MAKSVAVLDWTDIQSLMRMCSRAFTSNGPYYQILEAGRCELIDGLLIYLHEWLPGRQIDDEARGPLITALATFSEALGDSLNASLESGQGDTSLKGLYDECLRIQALLLSALRSGDSPQAAP